jgi:glutathione S-transferase
LRAATGSSQARQAQNDNHSGRGFTAADIMNVFLTTMHLFHRVDLVPCPSMLDYLGRTGVRPAFQRAMAKGDADLVPMLS